MINIFLKKEAIHKKSIPTRKFYYFFFIYFFYTAQTKNIFIMKQVTLLEVGYFVRIRKAFYSEF